MTARSVHTISKEGLREKARLIRLETLRMTDICGSGHYGSSFSMAELVAVLYYRYMHVRKDDPQWQDRDRFTMGKGHAAIGLFPVLSDIGFFPQAWLDTYTRFKSPLGDHPDMKKVPGVDFSSGSIGHNLSVSVGMALGTKRRQSPSRTVCLMGDGEQTEGQIWEAAISAAHWGLDNLIAMNMPDGRPTCILAYTVSGKGVSFMEGGWEWHLGFLGPKDLTRAYKEVLEGTVG
jgi:transketolase